MILDLSQNCPHIFADDANEDQLHGEEEEQADHQRSQPQRERVPVHQFIDEICQRNKQADSSKTEARKRRQPQRKLGMSDKTGHGNVVQGKEIMFGPAMFASRLHKFDLGSAEPNFTDQAAEVRDRVIILFQCIHKPAVIKAEPAEVEQ